MQMKYMLADRNLVVFKVTEQTKAVLNFAVYYMCSLTTHLMLSPVINSCHSVYLFFLAGPLDNDPLKHGTHHQ